VGAVGPDCHVTLWVIAPAAQWNVIVPAGMVSGVGEKELLATVIVVEWPPAGGGGGGGGGGGAGGGLAPVLLPHPDPAATISAATANRRSIRIRSSRRKGKVSRVLHHDYGNS
jgi:hypothetical protein